MPSRRRINVSDMGSQQVRPREKLVTASSAIVVVGASEAIETLARLLAQLPADFPGAVFVVHHMAADTDGKALLRALDRSGPLRCSYPEDGEKIKTGHVYVAPPDHHLLVAKGHVKVTKGARENGQRPAIDPLFRSAAVAYGTRVVGIVLTGYLDDGTAGLVDVKRCGGTCIVQDPADATYADMPLNALAQVDADHCIPLAEMGATLTQFASTKPRRRPAVPPDIRLEAKVAERVLSDLQTVDALGKQVPFNCPGCGGVLWKMSAGDSLRYRCHTGHSFTAPVLLGEQTAKIEETLWIALRMLEERRNLLGTMAKFRSSKRPKGRRPESANRRIFATAGERAREADVHIKRIRALLRAGEGPAEAERQRGSNGGD